MPASRRVHCLALLLAGAFPAACRDFAAPALPTGAVAMAAPDEYRAWWSQVQRCAQHWGSFDRVHWFWTPGQRSFRYDGDAYDGYWFEYRHQIVLGGDYVHDAMTVRHEMLHDILNVGGHPRAYFVQRCGAIVAHDP